MIFSSILITTKQVFPGKHLVPHTKAYPENNVPYRTCISKNFVSIYLYKGSSFDKHTEWSFVALFTAVPAKLKQNMTHLPQAPSVWQATLLPLISSDNRIFFSSNYKVKQKFILMISQNMVVWGKTGMCDLCSSTSYLTFYFPPNLRLSCQMPIQNAIFSFYSFCGDFINFRHLKCMCTWQ